MLASMSSYLFAPLFVCLVAFWQGFFFRTFSSLVCLPRNCFVLLLKESGQKEDVDCNAFETKGSTKAETANIGKKKIRTGYRETAKKKRTAHQGRMTKVRTARRKDHEGEKRPRKNQKPETAHHESTKKAVAATTGRTTKAKKAQRNDHKGRNSTQMDQKGKNSAHRKDQKDENTAPRKDDRGENSTEEGPRRRKPHTRRRKLHGKEGKTARTAHKGTTQRWNGAQKQNYTGGNSC